MLFRSTAKEDRYCNNGFKSPELILGSGGNASSRVDQQLRLKIDSYIVTLPEGEQEQLRERARKQLGSSQSEEEEVIDQMRRIVAEKLRVRGV